MKNEQVDVKRVQDTLLAMAKEIARILERHGIPHIIMYGTLLGAVRHKGFIPWDDDFDFILFDDTYDKAIEYLRDELPENCFLEDKKSEPLYFHGWAHVKDVNSEAYCEAYPHDSMYSHKGVSVDLYRAYKMKKSEAGRFLNQQNELYIKRRFDSGLMDEAEHARRIERLRNDKNNADCYAGDDTEVYALFSGFPLIYTTNVFPLKKYVFEDTEFYGPQNATQLLKDKYGDFMTLPPVEDRQYHYSSVKFGE
jgi:lipopolysaccharide cholinephosphotransferase